MARLAVSYCCQHRTGKVGLMVVPGELASDAP